VTEESQQELHIQEVIDVSSQLARNYTTKYRYSRQAYAGAMQLLRSRSSEPGLLLDIGTGTGATVTLLRDTFPCSKLVALDVSRDMFDAANWLPLWDHAMLARAEQLPFARDCVDIVLCCLAFHLLDKEVAMGEFGRVLKPNGLLMLIVYEPADHRQQLFLKYFPEYAESELVRHPNLPATQHLAARHSCLLVDHGRYEYDISFPSVREFTALIRSKPFYGLRMMSDAQFETGFRAFQQRVRKVFGDDPVVARSAISVWLFRKKSTAY
jgi:ubiquinone/menaquinone biosynthesis C-methylase UbiE